MTRYKPTRLRPSEGGRMRSMGPADPMDVCRAALAEDYTVRELPGSVGVTSVAPWEDPAGKGHVHINYHVAEPDPAVLKQIRAAMDKAIHQRLANKVGPVEPPVPPVDEELERERRRLVGKRVRSTVAPHGKFCMCVGCAMGETLRDMRRHIEEPKRTTFGNLKVGQRFRFAGFDGYGVCIRDVGDLFRDENRLGWGGIMNPDEPVEVVTMADKHLGKLRFVSYADNGGTAADEHEHERADVWLKEVDGQLYREGLRLAGKMVRRPECWSPDDWPAVWGPIDEVTRDNLGRVIAKWEDHANRVGYCALAEDCEVVTDAG